MCISPPSAFSNGEHQRESPLSSSVLPNKLSSVQGDLIDILVVYYIFTMCLLRVTTYLTH